jgi:hypothetical protein
MMSAVATPGRKGTTATSPPLQGLCQPRRDDEPCAGAHRFRQHSLAETVPAPTIALDRGHRLIADADGVRKVTSITGNPASTNVCASAAGSIEPSSVRTDHQHAPHHLVHAHANSLAKLPRRRQAGCDGEEFYDNTLHPPLEPALAMRRSANPLVANRSFTVAQPAGYRSPIEMTRSASTSASAKRAWVPPISATAIVRLMQARPSHTASPVHPVRHRQL